MIFIFKIFTRTPKMPFQILKCCEQGCSYTTSGRSAHPLKDLREHSRTKHSFKEVERGECIKITNPFLGTIRRCAGTNCNVDSDRGCPEKAVLCVEPANEQIWLGVLKFTSERREPDTSVLDIGIGRQPISTMIL